MTARLARSNLSVPSDATEHFASATQRPADAALVNGNGVVLDDDGRMVDKAMVRQRRRLLMLTNSYISSHRDEEKGRR
jgi:hypothetical protein